MPAEWEPHEATWIAWPHNRDRLARPLRAHPVGIRRNRAQAGRVERVRILVQSAALEKQARRVLEKVGADLEAVEFFRVRNRSRLDARLLPALRQERASGEMALTEWRFNAWAKYDDWRKDAAVPAFLAKRLKLPVFTPEMVLEGGSIDVNGEGCC